MPELPEVETVARQLRKVLLDRKIAKVEVFKAKSFAGNVEEITGSSVKEIRRRSKIIQILLSNNLSLLIHLKMSGQLIFDDGKRRVGGGHPTADWVQALPSKHTRVMLTFSDGSHLYFNDQRIFGWIRVANDEILEENFKDLAPDVIDSEVTTEYLYQKSQKRKMPIKQFIMDNTIVAGVGNIYACDALNLAKIAPTRPANELGKSEVEKLLKAMRTVVELGIEMGGATAHGEYVNVEGLAGKYQNVMRVYGKKGEACPNCGSEIQKIKLGGRGTFFCSNCQK